MGCGAEHLASGKHKELPADRECHFVRGGGERKPSEVGERLFYPVRVPLLNRAGKNKRQAVDHLACFRVVCKLDRPQVRSCLKDNASRRRVGATVTAEVCQRGIAQLKLGVVCVLAQVLALRIARKQVNSLVGASVGEEKQTLECGAPHRAFGGARKAGSERNSLPRRLHAVAAQLNTPELLHGTSVVPARL